MHVTSAICTLTNCSIKVLLTGQTGTELLLCAQDSIHKFCPKVGDWAWFLRFGPITPSVYWILTPNNPRWENERS